MDMVVPQSSDTLQGIHAHPFAEHLAQEFDLMDAIDLDIQDGKYDNSEMNNDIQLDIGLQDNESDISPFNEDLDVLEIPMTTDVKKEFIDDEAVSDADSEDDNARVDSRLERLFPMEALRMPRKDFSAWRKKYHNSRVRNLSPKETKRLAAKRRTILARVYAERARARKGLENQEVKVRLREVQAENAKLKETVARLEQTLKAIREGTALSGSRRSGARVRGSFI